MHVPPGDERSTVDWPALARSDGTLVLMMSLERVGAVTSTLMKHGRPGDCPVSVIADGTMPTQRTIYSTLEDVERRLTDEGVRPPAVVVIGGVVAFALWNTGLRHWKTSQVYLFNNLIPLSNMAWANVCLGEPITGRFWISMSFIASGVLLGYANFQRIFGARWLPFD